MADEALKFESEEAKADAIAKYDEATGSPDDLERLMGAPVEVPQKAEAEVTPPQSAEEVPPEESPKEETPEVFNWDTWANEQGYKSAAEARKAFDEAKATLKRQQDFINEKLNKVNAPVAKVVAAPVQQEKVQTQVSKIDDIKQAINSVLVKRRDIISQLRNDPSLQMDPDFLSQQAAVEEEKYSLDLQMAEELNNIRTLHENTNQQLTSLTKNKEEELRREQAERMYQTEMDEIQKFALNPKHPEFSFSSGKDSFTVEGEYVAWANKVATALYGQPVNMLRGGAEREAVASALERLSQKDPEVINACQVTGAPIEPSEDVRKYLDICELLDHRDGLKKDPVTGQKVQQTRMVYDSVTGAFRKDPVRFASLEDAYNHKLVVDGTFSRKIKEAYSKGGKDMATAAAKRAAAPVQLGNATGASQKDVGLSMTPQEALEIISKFDETEAHRRKMSGDGTMVDQYEKAMAALASVKI